MVVREITRSKHLSWGTHVSQKCIHTKVLSTHTRQYHETSCGFLQPLVQWLSLHTAKAAAKLFGEQASELK
jgi:hypothetical protein